jgi:hypothetical protein
LSRRGLAVRGSRQWWHCDSPRTFALYFTRTRACCYCPFQSGRLSRKERVTVDIEQPRLLFPTGTAEGIDQRADPNIDEPDLFQHVLPGCARQTTGNSGRPKVDVLNGRFGYRFAVRNVSEPEATAGAEYAINFCENRALVGAKVYHAVADDNVRPSVFDRQAFRKAFPELHIASPSFTVVARDFASISSVMSMPITLPVGPP